MGFFIIVEVLFHYAAFFVYINPTNPTVPLVNLLPVFVTFTIFLFFQILAILLANRKILKVRPIIALKRVGV